ncbi:leucine-rich repeat domain-containing protein [Mycoplasma zalophi]|uniref:leucine-rich repeat domain-containing protein n=1 Tax=Mycoplasma zalophi TaxID=191287 RepID=UPI0021C66E89|nr:leucine-rich repeat domain-containing protein [Mycoplasma zalophi]MCU4116899.1 leucine-rich repeat domain-containing protein [Mycoplasma zalophi]
MNTKRTKLLFSLGLLSIITLPIAVVSCGQQTEASNNVASVYFQTNKDKQNIFYNPQTKVLDLSSTQLKEIRAASFSRQALKNIFISDEEFRQRVFDNEEKRILISKVIFPETLEKIEKGAFFDLGLETVDFSKATKLHTIEENAFGDNKIQELSLPQSVTNLGKNAFSNNNISNVTLPENLKALNSFVFYNNKLTTIDLSHIITVNEFALGANNISELTLPETLTRFALDALDYKEKTQTNKTVLDVKNTELKNVLITNDEHHYTIKK